MAEMMDIVCEGLRFPEGPVALADGSVLLVEVAAGLVSRVFPDGRKVVVARPGGGPNGLAIGPDGAAYLCNNGGMMWHTTPEGGLMPGMQPADYSGGRIERIDLRTGQVRVLYTQGPNGPLRGPNDIVFDAAGGFWFTDMGKQRPNEMDPGAVYYAKIDGSEIRELISPMITPNGIGLSPAGDKLYVAESGPARVWAFDLEGPGQVVPGSVAGRHGGTRLARLTDGQMLDSLAVDAAGNVCVATLHHGGITVVAPDGRSVEHIAMPDSLTTNICFGGADMKTAYITLSLTGRLARVAWAQPGLKLHWSDKAVPSNVSA
ncbi:MAG: SMP-30/gluconolactonase/LRE family protein [Sulfuricaulis sp.]|nr:SMP-30/gluconolactonase/LRE family protein [Sulfuricaulis sp.]